MNQFNQFKDVCTIFSIAPFEIFETKPGIYPGNYRIPKCMDQRVPSRLLVEKSINIMTIGGTRKPIPVETASYVMANSVVQDCINSQMWSAPNCGPGIAWIHGDISVKVFLENHKDIYDRMIEQQHNWFKLRCQKVDDEWSRFKTHRVVSDVDRFAAASLGLNPEWLQSEEVYGFSKCPACNTMNNPENAVCTNCSCILNKEKYAKLEFAK